MQFWELLRLKLEGSDLIDLYLSLMMTWILMELEILGNFSVSNHGLGGDFVRRVFKEEMYGLPVWIQVESDSFIPWSMLDVDLLFLFKEGCSIWPIH